MKPESPLARIPVEKVAEADFPSRFGHFRICGFRLLDEAAPEVAVVLVKGEPLPGKIPLVRIHSQCLTGDVFGSFRCDCREQLEMALTQIGASEYGFLIYEQQEGRGIGLLNKLRAYALQDQGMDTVEANRELGYEADLRHYSLAAGILQYYQVGALRLLSNNPEKLRALEAAGISVPERIPIAANPQPGTARYLKTKREKMGHWFPDPEIKQKKDRKKNDPETAPLPRFAES
ncbi:MAG: GTP cyclohydrolase II [Acidobacteria bacterium]|nr:GTP cyclohydrolase II [Acidobacteriota bacterium]